LYAKDGYFSGTISTSRIVGNGNASIDYALTIEAENVKKAIVFKENNAPVEYVSIEKSGTFFYETEN
jgi:hypothetical protein